MRTFIPHAITLCLTMALLILPADVAFSQSDESQRTESVDEEDPSYVKGITSARARSLVGGVLGLLSLIIGWRSKVRAAVNKKPARRWSAAALVLGLVAIILSIVHLSINTGDFGTGGGKAGAIVALALGIIGTTFSGLTLRSSAR